MMWMRFSAGDHPAYHHNEGGDDVSDVLTVLLPWLISILLHVGVVLLAVFVVWSTVQETDEEEVIVPSSQLSETPGTPLETTETERETQKSSQSSSSAQRSLAKSSSQSESSSLASSSQSESSSLIASAASGGGSAGKSSPFGGQSTASAQFKSTFFGTGGNAKRIAYLIDASGSLVDTMPFVIVELKRSIGELSEKQKFTVLFFQGNDYVEVPPPGLARATSGYKQEAIQWVDLESGNIVPAGTASPIAAIKKSLQYNPQLLYILSDNITGQGPYEVDQQQLLSAITSANDGTKINTIQFLYEDPLKQYGLPRTLERVSDKTGGVFKFLDARELGVQ